MDGREGRWLHDDGCAANPSEDVAAASAEGLVADKGRRTKDGKERACLAVPGTRVTGQGQGDSLPELAGAGNLKPLG